MAMLLPREIQAAIIESLVAKDSDAHFYQDELCLTCKTAISESQIIKRNRWGEIETLVSKPMDLKYRYQPNDIVEIIDHHQNLESLSESLRQGCHLCSLLSASIQTGIEPPHCLSDTAMSKPSSRVSRSPIYQRMFVLEVSCSTFFSSRGALGKENGRMRLCEREPAGTQVVYGPNLYLDFTHMNDKLSSKPEALLTLSTSSPTSFRWAKLTLDQCLSHHDVCSSAYKSATYAPRRLLDLSHVEYNGTMRLVVVNLANDARPQYATLSHRWGNEPIACLLMENEANLQESLSVDDLPLTFQQAAMVTLSLGLRYIWIDSLCIIQDSPIDWEHESAIMGDIYRGSVCTIAACSAINRHEGLFTPRNPLLDLPCILTEDAGVTMGSEFTRLPPDYLSSRGWIVQERTLSPRTLFYRAGAISWECVETEIDERGVKDPFDQPKSRFHNLTLLDSEKVDLSAPSKSLILFHKYWSRLLVMYTTTDLTKASDKLVAINGIISKVQKAMRFTPLAGLWKDMLPAELLWKVNKPSELPLAKEYRAPSWSWASVDSGITHQFVKLFEDSHKLSWELDVLQAEATTAPNGQVSSASIHLRGPLRKFQRASKNADEGYMVSPEIWSPDTGVYDASEDFYALLILRTGLNDLRDTGAGLELQMCDAGLILAPVEGTKNVFRRRGYFKELFWPSLNVHTFCGNIKQDKASFTVL